MAFDLEDSLGNSAVPSIFFDLNFEHKPNVSSKYSRDQKPGTRTKENNLCCYMCLYHNLPSNDACQSHTSSRPSLNPVSQGSPISNQCLSPPPDTKRYFHASYCSSLTDARHIDDTSATITPREIVSVAIRKPAHEMSRVLNMHKC